MRFRLTYNGPLKSTQPSHVKVINGLHTDRRAEHKHEIRKEFHKQLRHLWKTNRFLSEERLTNPYPAGVRSRSVLPPSADKLDWGNIPNDGVLGRGFPMANVLAECYGHSGYRFVPLVRQEISLACSLSILFLRRDFPAPVLSAGDLDNRLKTLIDALRMPQPNEVPVLPTGGPVLPIEGEDPFFVLLDDDRQITHLEVEADAALAASEVAPCDSSFVRLTITVDVRPYHIDIFNMSFG